MFGWINDCTECLVLSKFGHNTWREIKSKANCQVKDGGFLRYKYYPDSDTIALVVAASEVTGLSVDEVLHAFGDYFIDYVQDNGYSNVLECLGSNLCDWLSNLNSLHDHLQASYPKGFVAPVFWSEDDNAEAGDADGAIFVHYFSHRGPLLVPLVVGCIKKLSKVYFDIDIEMEQLQLQDDATGINHTSWRVTTVNPNEAYKLRGRKLRHRYGKDSSGDSISGEDETISTESTTVSNYYRTFREGGTQASNLRVEEFVKRSFRNPNCELYYALTKEHFVYLVDYWKTNKNSNGLWCYETWEIHDEKNDSWAKLEDLPPKLNPATIHEDHFGGKTPQTGAYPPDENHKLQSFPPKVVVVNDITGKSATLTVAKDPSLTLQNAIYDHPALDDHQIKIFPPEWEEKLQTQDFHIKIVVWNDEIDDAYHIFSQEELPTISTWQLYELIPKTFDPIKLYLQCDERAIAEDDEEDI
ncbi:hem-NO-binding domain containing protein [Nitzschia inconspicua]|uniref:Hem-NO-binding domain containing protein n=1 Tax=Nitzschia inconspicua TaxID=303405 RepID=A0A9K3L025_9STRA|nr:hem-NO-binding domain containing protein [Nitzschia inconspicua]